jgi:hypothetical protein
VACRAGARRAARGAALRRQQAHARSTHAGSRATAARGLSSMRPLDCHHTHATPGATHATHATATHVDHGVTGARHALLQVGRAAAHVQHGLLLRIVGAQQAPQRGVPEKPLKHGRFALVAGCRCVRACVRARVVCARTCVWREGGCAQAWHSRPSMCQHCCDLQRVRRLPACPVAQRAWCVHHQHTRSCTRCC